MSRRPAGAGPAGPASYELRLQGALDPRWSAWFEGLRVTSDHPGQTTIAGPINDQAALHGLLAKVRDLGLSLLEVRRLDPDREAAQAWVAAFAEGWQAPTSADAFADHFQPWFDPQIRLIQPQLSTLVGHHAFRERFARPLFTLIPDLHGQVERSAVGHDCAYVDLTLRGTLGGRPVAWRVCDRATLRDGLVIERESYFDPLPLLRAILTRPRAWPTLARARRRERRHRPGRRDERDAALGLPPARPPADRIPGG